MHGTPVGNEMGVNTWAAFAGTDERAVVDGDFAMREEELQTVLKVLRREGINIVAIHNHMTHEEPRYVFLHYWGKGKAAELAQLTTDSVGHALAFRALGRVVSEPHILEPIVGGQLQINGPARSELQQVQAALKSCPKITP